ncbi:MAG TPA: hypothetical protein VJR89_10115 [Polyangiales bacterium]|nr:hypothetical protein [Polyangiales bacterium]
MQAWLFTLAVLLLAPAPAALAHDPGLSELTLRQSGERVEFSWVVSHADLPAERRATAPQCSAIGVLVASVDGRALPIAGRCRLQDPGHTAFDGSFSVPQSGELAVRLGELDLPRGHRCFARFLDAQAQPVARALLAQVGEPLRAHVAVPGQRATVLGFAVLGLALLALGIETRRRASCA